MTRRRRPRWEGWYVCEWDCGRRFRRGADYTAHVQSKHTYASGMPHEWPETVAHESHEELNYDCAECRAEVDYFLRFGASRPTPEISR